MRFYRWYTQALGSVLGMISCIYCYLRGDLLLYYILSGNYDSLHFRGIIASYTLYPLCILTFILSICSISNTKNKKVLGIDFNKVNTSFKYITIIIGLLGCDIYFIVPTLFLIFPDILLFIKYIRNKPSIKEAEICTDSTLDSYHNNLDNNETELNPILTIKKTRDDDYIATKTEMAIQLINEDSSIDFIKEITGLPLEYIKKLQSENLRYTNKEKNSTIS